MCKSTNCILLMYLFKCVLRSANKKTGNIMQVYTTTIEDLQGSCPTSCPLKKICYAKTGMNTRRAWGEANITLEELKAKVQKRAAYLIKKGECLLVRHNVAGDIALPGTDLVNIDLLSFLTNEVYKGLKAYTYTHCNVRRKVNRDAVKNACENGFTINFSCETVQQVKHAVHSGCPAVLTVATMQDNTKEVDGIKFLKCPATVEGSTKTCKTCGICQRAKRGCVVVFPVHGNGSKAEKEKTNLLKW